MRLFVGISLILACLAFVGNQAQAQTMLVVLDDLDMVEDALQDDDSSNPPATTESTGPIGQSYVDPQSGSGGGGGPSSPGARTQGGGTTGGAGGGGGNGGGGGGGSSDSGEPEDAEESDSDSEDSGVEEEPVTEPAPLDPPLITEPISSSGVTITTDVTLPVTEGFVEDLQWPDSSEDEGPLVEEPVYSDPTPIFTIDGWGEQARPLSLAVGEASDYGQMPEATSLTIFGLLGASGLALRPRIRRDDD